MSLSAYATIMWLTQIIHTDRYQQVRKFFPLSVQFPLSLMMVKNCLRESVMEVMSANTVIQRARRIAATREGNLVRLADRIAYINHDIDDAIRGGIICEDDLPKSCTEVLGHSKSARITKMLTSVIEHGAEVPDMMPDIRKAHDELHAWLYANVYSNSAAKTEEPKAIELICRLYTYYRAHPEKMPEEYQAIVKRYALDRAVCDYIAGMSDDYAIRTYEYLFVPRSWDVR